jgi:type VI secretion system protein ImpH
MAAEVRPDYSVVEATKVRWARVDRLLHEVPQEFRFFQAVRLMQLMFREREPVGRFVSPSKEVARFRSHNSLPFPASEIQDVLWPEPPGVPQVIVNFMGLTGPQGVMPLYYTALIAERLRAKDASMAAFFDIFNHRMISLFYQAWEKYRFALPYERSEPDRFSHHLMDLVGLGTAWLQNRLAVRDDALLFYTGLLGLHPRSATALRQVLEDYFAVPVAIEQFIGGWYPLDTDTQCELAVDEDTSEQIGIGAVVGDAVWDQQSAVRVRLGPLTLLQYLDFLPSGSAYRPLQALTKFYSGGRMDFEVQLVLKRDEVPSCELGRGDDAAPALGWVSWAKSVELGRDPGDTILRI